MAQRTFWRLIFAPTTDRLGIRSAPLQDQSEEAWARPTGASDVTRDRAQRAVGPAGVGEASLLHRNRMGAAVPFAHEARACSDLHALNCRLLTGLLRLPARGKLASGGLTEPTIAKLLNTIGDSANE